MGRTSSWKDRICKYCMGLTGLLFFENNCLAERVSRILLGTAEPERSLAKLIRFFRLRERAGPGTGRGRGRNSQWAPPLAIPRWPNRAAPRSAVRVRRENPPPVEKNTI